MVGAMLLLALWLLAPLVVAYRPRQLQADSAHTERPTSVDAASPRAERSPSPPVPSLAWRKDTVPTSTALTLRSDLAIPVRYPSAVATPWLNSIATPVATRIRRPRFRERPRFWWLLSLFGYYQRQPRIGVSPAVLLGRTRRSEARLAPLGSFVTALAQRPTVVVAILGVLVGAFIISDVRRSGSGVAPLVAANPVAAGTFSPTFGPGLPILAVLGTTAGLSGPHGAAVLADGTIAVADTGNGRIALLDSTGRLKRSIRAGSAPFAQPYAVAGVKGGFVVLDAKTGTIDRFDTAGRFVRRIAQTPALAVGRSLAVGPDGRYYVANPFINSIVILTATGTIQREITSPLSDIPGQFNQPTDVAVGADGTLYVLDNQNNRIEALSASGAFRKQWPAPASPTTHSVQLVVLPGQRLLATDPSGGVVLYTPTGSTSIRRALEENGELLASQQVQLTGITPLARGKYLVIDSRFNRLFLVALP